ncbi:hypothetical protein MAR_015456 [Mya arenaria]|uniref:Uncharacterized protein n=1 Tax=Mya arenaria TaxID=6604 RepID=A0ABY7FIT7_MYAAR|nr:hypothetical protein MAR_015456 [Mya arenaria]
MSEQQWERLSVKAKQERWIRCLPGGWRHGYKLDVRKWDKAHLNVRAEELAYVSDPKGYFPWNGTKCKDNSGGSLPRRFKIVKQLLHTRTWVNLH